MSLMKRLQMKQPEKESATRRAMRLHEAIEFPCPYCGAKRDEPCSTANGDETYEHTARLILRNLVEAKNPPDRTDNSRVARLARTLRAVRPRG